MNAPIDQPNPNDDVCLTGDCAQLFPVEASCTHAVDCVAEVSACTSACETAAQRTVVVTTAPEYGGAACPEPTDCYNGEDECARCVADQFTVEMDAAATLELVCSFGLDTTSCETAELAVIAAKMSECPPLTTEEVAAATATVTDAMAAAFDADDDAVATVPVVEIAAQVSFPIAISAIAEGTEERTEFENGFKTQMAENIGGISADRVIIDAITGSRRRTLAADAQRMLQDSGVNVDFHIVAPASVRSEAAQLVAAVDATAVTITVGNQG